MHSVTHTIVSRVINAPIDRVWEQIRSGTLEFWNSAVRSAEKIDDHVYLSFRDGSEQKIRVVGRHLLRYELCYELVARYSSLCDFVLFRYDLILLARIANLRCSFLEPRILSAFVPSLMTVELMWNGLASSPGTRRFFATS